MLFLSIVTSISPLRSSNWKNHLRKLVEETFGADTVVTYVTAEMASTAGVMLVTIIDSRDEGRSLADRRCLEGVIATMFQSQLAPSEIQTVHFICPHGGHSYSFDPRKALVGMMA